MKREASKIALRIGFRCFTRQDGPLDSFLKEKHSFKFVCDTSIAISYQTTNSLPGGMAQDTASRKIRKSKIEDAPLRTRGGVVLWEVTDPDFGVLCGLSRHYDFQAAAPQNRSLHNAVMRALTLYDAHRLIRKHKTLNIRRASYQ